MSTNRGKGLTIPADKSDDTKAGSASSSSARTVRGYGPTLTAGQPLGDAIICVRNTIFPTAPSAGAPENTLAGSGATITTGSARSAAVDLNTLPPGSPITLGGSTYNLDSLLSHATGEAEIFLLSLGGTHYVLKLYHSNFTPDEDVVHLLKDHQHRNLAGVLEFGWYSPVRFYEIMDYFKGGSLDTYAPIRNMATLKTIVQSVNRAFNFIHDMGLVHKDIKPANLYLRSADNYDVLLGDFGISSALDSGKSRDLMSQSLTPGYAAPEMYGLVDTNVAGGVKVIIGTEVDYYALWGYLLYISGWAKAPLVAWSSPTGRSRSPT